MRWWRRYSGSPLLETRNRQGSWEVHCTLYCLEFCIGFNDSKRQHLSTINTDSDFFYDYTAANISKKTVNGSGRRQFAHGTTDEKRPSKVPRDRKYMHRKASRKTHQRTAWILSHVLRKTLCEHVNGLCPAGWLNEQSITKHWFQSVRTCPYRWVTGRNNTNDKICRSRWWSD